MPTPQPGIFALGHRSLHHLQLDLEPGVAPDVVHDALARIGDVSTIRFGVSAVIGVAADVWNAIEPGGAPDLGRFVERRGADDVTMAAGQHDLWFFLQASAPDAVFDAARLVERELRDIARVVEEWPSFTYRSSQDMTGFEDGTENPPLSELPGVATVPDGSPGAGGSVVLLQRWVHDLDSFAELPRDEQEQVIGRTLYDSRGRHPRPAHRLLARGRVGLVLRADAGAAPTRLTRSARRVTRRVPGSTRCRCPAPRCR